ncbi:MAG: hypothetical protein N2A99_01005 [Carnobacterium alterfunditum]
MFKIKRYIVFISSFIVLHLCYSLVSGFLLTSMFISSTSLLIPQTVVEPSPTLNFIVFLLIATMAYFISQRDFEIVGIRPFQENRN